jgi:hypothetical protein
MKQTIKADDFTFDSLYRNLMLPLFSKISSQDDRKPNKRYDLSSALKSGYALFALKSASLFSFQKHTEVEKSNLASIFKITKTLSDNGLRTILDRIDSDLLRSNFKSIINYLEDRNILSSYRFWNNHLLISIDGVEHFKSNNINCTYCLKRTHRNGKESYYHSMLSAAIVCPRQTEVFIAENEPIVKQDGVVKNDCERNAAKRLFKKLLGSFGSQPVVYVLDALYSCAPIIKEITSVEGWEYISNITEKGHRHLYEQFDELNDEYKITWKEFRRKKDRYLVGFANGLELNKSNPDVKTNMLYCRFKPVGKPEKVFSWITNIGISSDNVKDVIDMGRSRWKIENEVFNTLKNQEYNFEHNFGHGKKHLATNFAYLMMMAFTIDQIQQRCNRYFKSLHKGLKTRVKIWESTRSIFKMIACISMTELQRNLLKMYQIQII